MKEIRHHFLRLPVVVGLLLVTFVSILIFHTLVSDRKDDVSQDANVDSRERLESERSIRDGLSDFEGETDARQRLANLAPPHGDEESSGGSQTLPTQADHGRMLGREFVANRNVLPEALTPVADEGAQLADKPQARDLASMLEGVT